MCLFVGLVPAFSFFHVDHRTVGHLITHARDHVRSKGSVSCLLTEAALCAILQNYSGHLFSPVRIASPDTHGAVQCEIWWQSENDHGRCMK